MAATATLIARIRPDLVLPLGDEQYNEGGLDAFRTVYTRTWGRFANVSRPVPGNHEYLAQHAAGYYTYFGARAGDPSKGYYSFDEGNWHFIAINANCSAIGGCHAGSPEERWLKSDLRDRKHACTLAYWHQPRFSSGLHHSDSTYAPFWEDLYAAGADIVLNGHDHLYERFAPQSASGTTDARRGIREFIVGTGGRSHYVFRTIERNSQVRNNTTFGILVLQLRDRGYQWRFQPEDGKTFTDRGSSACHR